MSVKKILKEAEDKGISPYLVIKRQNGYKKAGDEVSCQYCKNAEPVQFSSGKKLCCHEIGVMDSKLACVDFQHTCKKHRFGRRIKDEELQG
jgi:hypothetical protein